jgi:hypothetical protein
LLRLAKSRLVKALFRRLELLWGHRILPVPNNSRECRVDIRSDLYSLGATLWKMLTGQTPFRGTSAELMYRHLHAPLPTSQLKHVPQPVVVLVEVLLEKDPGQRFQNPAELLKAIPTIKGAIDARRRITRQGLQKMPSTASQVGTGKPPAKLAPKKISVARLPVIGSNVFGREEDVAFLDDAWANRHANVVTIVAWAGVGKSTLVNNWLRRMAAEHYRSAELIFGWSFYRQGSSGETASADEFLDGGLEMHPLVREYFGEQLRTQQRDAWKECNGRLFDYYQTVAPQLPNSFREMEPLFSAVICGCNAGLFREALNEVYIPRIQRGNACFAANVLGARGPLLSVVLKWTA